MNYQVLHDELTNDPLGRGYGSMTDIEAANDLNTAYRTRIASFMSGDQIFQQTDPTEFAGLADHKQDLWVSFCSRDSVDPSSSANVEFVKWIFGSQSTTISNLNTARSEDITRAEELGLGEVNEGDVYKARAL